MVGKNQSVGKGHTKWIWRAGLWPTGRLLHTPGVELLEMFSFCGNTKSTSFLSTSTRHSVRLTC